MSELSPQSGPMRTLISSLSANCDFMGTHPKVLLLPSRTHIDVRLSNAFLKIRYWTSWTDGLASRSLPINCSVVLSSRKVSNFFVSSPHERCCCCCCWPWRLRVAPAPGHRHGHCPGHPLCIYTSSGGRKYITFKTRGGYHATTQLARLLPHYPMIRVSIAKYTDDLLIQ
jgi:hypothetical protein